MILFESIILAGIQDLGPAAISFIIGAIFIFAGVSGKIGYEKFSIDLKQVWQRIVFSLIGAFLWFIAIDLIFDLGVFKRNEGRECEVCITVPSDGDEVVDPSIIKGVYRDEQTDLWVMIWPEQSGNKVYPQFDTGRDGISMYRSNGTWSVTGNFGGPPQHYDILLYSATKEASEEIRTILEVWIANDNYEGINSTDLPDGLLELDRITVSKAGP